MVINGSSMITSPIDNGFAVPVKWKPRSVSAVRDFPPGCGPIVVELADNGVNDGETQLAQTVESLPHLQNGDHQVVMENGGDSSGVKEDMQNGDNHPVEDVKILPVNEIENGGVAVEENTQNTKFPRRRVSAVRDFPPYCGPNATEPTEDERKRINGDSYVGPTEAMVLDDKPNNELVVHRKDNIVSRVSSDDEDRHDDTDIQEMLNRSVALVQNDIKNVTGQKPGLHKRPFDDENRHLVIGLQVSDDEEGHQNDSKRQKIVKNKDKQKVGHDTSLKKQKLGHDASLKKQKVSPKPLNVRPRLTVVGLQAKSLYAESSPKLQLTNVDDSIKVEASVTPKLVAKKSHKKKVKVFGESSGAVPVPVPYTGTLELTNVDDSIKAESSGSAFTTPKLVAKKSHKKKVKALVPYTGTLEMVVREDENITPKTEEEGDWFFNSYNSGPRDVVVTLPPTRHRSSNDARNKVRETLRCYHSVLRKLIRCEESQSADFMASYQKKRVDLAAKAVMEREGKLMDLGPKQCGPVPGVEVGDEFQYRVELALVGIHRPFQGGIDSVKRGKDVFAVSIVASGGYDNEIDKPDCLIYSGAGGVTKEKTIEDQKLERGNLALYNNIAANLPVRVVRGWKSSETSDLDSKTKIMTTYIYDGLYTVNDCKRETGPKGNLVFKFELKRIPGQPELAVREVKSKKFRTKREGVLSNDITNGKESFRICAINTIDDEAPPLFTYITKIMYPDWYRPVLPNGCSCVGRCSDKKCGCARKNGGEIPYNRNGAIVEAKSIVYECGPTCGCPPSCYNRVTQHGIKLKLEIFKTESRGWGVRSLSSISSGSFICEYIGELLEDSEAEKRTGNDEYLFDIGQKCSDSLYSDGEMVDKTGFTIDALHYGNVGRFINHSCTPNLYAQNVLYDQEDKRMPHIMLFAAENIPPLQELTYHYNYAVNTVHDAHGNIKIKNCYCGSSECTGRLY